MNICVSNVPDYYRMHSSISKWSFQKCFSSSHSWNIKSSIRLASKLVFSRYAASIILYFESKISVWHFFCRSKDVCLFLLHWNITSHFITLKVWWYPFIALQVVHLSINPRLAERLFLEHLIFLKCFSIYFLRLKKQTIILRKQYSFLKEILWAL